MKVAIVGGGAAGLVTAWLLEKTHQVTLFEKSASVGGHAQTFTVELGGRVRSVDTGVHFVAERLQPLFIRLLEHLDVPLAPYLPSATFHDRRDGWTVCLPPMGNASRWSGLTSRRNLTALAALRTLIGGAVHLVEASDDFDTPLEAFVDRLGISETARHGFLYPYLASYWGVSPSEVCTYSAKNALSYLVLLRPPLIRPRPMIRVAGGMRAYLDRLVAKLTRTAFERAASVAGVVRLGDRYAIELAGSAPRRVEGFDQVVLATNAAEAARILSRLPSTEAVRAVLGQVEYFETVVAVHGDPSFMPRNRAHWSLVNCIFDGHHAALTNREVVNGDVDLFRSWITHASRRPEPCYQEVRFFHPRPSPGYFRAQRLLEPHQGADNLWFAGMYVTGYDHHDGALASAVRVAKGLGGASPFG